MHDAMQDDVTHILHMTTFIALLLDGSGRQRHRINEYAILLVFPGTGPGGMCGVFLWWMWRVVMRKILQSSWNVSCCPGFRTAIGGRRGW